MTLPRTAHLSGFPSRDSRSLDFSGVLALLFERLWFGISRAAWYTPRKDAGRIARVLGVFLRGIHDHTRSRGSVSGDGWSRPLGESSTCRSSRCVLDGAHHEYRREPVDGSGFLSGLLRSVA